ncbi:MAG TPA: ATP-binding protein [Methylomirabilota bacterium]|jgi:signal transduction histidine kinase/CheY-like chemotaxis protein
MSETSGGDEASGPGRAPGYAVAAGAVVGAALLTWALWPLIQPSGTPLFFAAVAISSWYGGLGPGLLATALAAVVTERFFVPPLHVFTPATAVRGVSFVVVALLVASLYERARRAQARAEALARSREALLGAEKAAREAAETASRGKDEFLATLSHELRTPLNALVGWTWWLRRGDLDAERRTRALETIDRNVKAVAQRIEDLLDVSRIITGKIRLSVRTVELAPVIEAAVAAVQPAAAAKSIDIDLTLQPAVPPVRGDTDRLQQLVWNLLSNAIKFTPDKGRVSVRLDQGAGGVRIVVRDTGQGISPGVLPYVFDRFAQGGGGPRAGAGLGLGLAIARHVVELHGGEVRAESEGEGHGATFTVTLPRAVPDTPAAESAGAVGAAILQGLRILVVDDEPSAREWCQLTLGHYGARVIAAASAREALAALRREAADVLVSDLRLPGDDGYDLIRRVRGLDAERGGRTPAVALTGYPRVEDRNRALDAGYDAHVPKPVAVTELVSVVTLLAGRTAEDRA